MCDYSLQGLPNRLATEGEQLVTHRFRTGSIGLASPLDIAVRQVPQSPPADGSWWSKVKRLLAAAPEPPAATAVCIPPGSHLLMTRIPERIRREFSLRAVADVTFVQLSAEPFQYRDAIQFADGRNLLLQSLCEGVRFAVVSTQSSGAEIPEPESRIMLPMQWPTGENLR